MTFSLRKIPQYPVWFFLRQMKKLSSYNTFMNCILHYFTHLCYICFTYLLIHIKTPQTSFNYLT